MKSPKAHRKMTLEIIPEPPPRTRAVLVPTPEVCPVIRGKGNLDLLCGKCGAILVEGTEKGQIQNIVIRCPKCNSYNDILFHVVSVKPEFPKKKTDRLEER